jgi:N-acetylmuramoyl-L-alanine amidase
MKPTHIIIHCSASKWGNTAVIDVWHRERGFTNIGYNYVVHNGNPFSSRSSDRRMDGQIGVGRPVGVTGAHAHGYNTKSIGICVIGDKEFTTMQMYVLRLLVEELMQEHEIPVANVLGHYETTDGKAKGKTCPNFDMDEFRGRVS